MVSAYELRLQKNPDITYLSSDVDAIELALSEGVNSVQELYRGYGLSHVANNVKGADDRKMDNSLWNGYTRVPR